MKLSSKSAIPPVWLECRVERIVGAWYSAFRMRDVSSLLMLHYIYPPPLASTARALFAELLFGHGSSGVTGGRASLPSPGVESTSAVVVERDVDV